MSGRGGQKTRGALAGVSLGPGPPDLITVRALEALKQADRIYYPQASGANGKETESRCLQILRHYGLDTKSRPLKVDMKTRAAAEESYRFARGVLSGDINGGINAAVVCEGCVSLYSTVFRILSGTSGDFELIPGVLSPSAAAAEAGVCLGLGNDAVAVLSGALPVSEIERAAKSFDTVVVMKPSRAAGLAEMIKRTGLEFVYCRDIHGGSHLITRSPAAIEGGDFPYFSLFIISKRLKQCRAE